MVLGLYLGTSLLVGPIVGWRGLPTHRGDVWASAFMAGTILALAAPTLWLGHALDAFRAGAARKAPAVGWRAARGDVARVAVRVIVVVGAAWLGSALLNAWRLSIPQIVPFVWDGPFDAWDVALHGTRPWQLAHATLAHPWATGWLPPLLVWVYVRGWYVANLALVTVLALRPSGVRGQRVLIGYTLQYAVLGSLLATIYASAGPVYYGQVVTGPDPYATLPEAMRAMFGTSAEWTLRTQALLWERHLSGSELTVGITAFPSIHVASAALMALAAGSWRPWAGVVGWAIVAVILFGSVALGWHYAVDGYAAIVGMLALWWFAGRIVTLGPAVAPCNDRSSA